MASVCLKLNNHIINRPRKTTSIMKPFKYKVKKGDTLSGIAQKHGFRNWRDAGFTGYRSGDPNLIFPDEEITLENYDSEKVQTSGSPTTLIDSTQVSTKFKANGDIVNEKLGLNQDPNADVTVPPVQDISPTVEKIEPQKEPVKEIDGITDPNYVKSRLNDEAERETARIRMEDRKAESLLKIDTRLAQNDRRYAERVTRINRIWDKRIKVQNRLNKLKDDRIKAYGVGGSAIYQPINFTGAVSLSESESADKIAELDSFRDQLLNEAQNAFQTGESLILDDRIKEIDRIEAEMEQKYIQIERESEKQYKLFEKLEREEEAKNRIAREEAIKDFISYISLNFDENMTPEEEAVEIEKIMKNRNLTLSEAFNAIMEGKNINRTDFKAEKTKAEIEKIKAQTKTEKEKTKTEREKTKTEVTKQIKNLRVEKDTEKKGDKDLFSEAQLKELNRAGLQNAPKQQRIDFIDMDRDTYETKYPQGSSVISQTAEDYYKSLGL